MKETPVSWAALVYACLMCCALGCVVFDDRLVGILAGLAWVVFCEAIMHTEELLKERR